jgi:hypothetical protein
VQSSGGPNPLRMVPLLGRRYLYVLNGGDNGTNASITLFSFYGQGTLTQQNSFKSQGTNPNRILVDSSGSFLLVEDQQAPVGGAKGITNCPGVGDITVFRIDTATGRLTLVNNTQVTDQNTGAPLTYFCVGPSPVDMILTAGNVFSINGDASHRVYTYTFSATSGQLTANPNGSQNIGAVNPTAILPGPGGLLVLDNSPISALGSDGSTIQSPSRLLPLTVSTDGALQTLIGGAVANDPGASDPVWGLLETKNKKSVYVINKAVNGSNSLISGFNINTNNQLSFMPGEPFSTGPAPTCLVEDTSNQYMFTGNSGDNTMSVFRIIQATGALSSLSFSKATTLPGPPSWCLATSTN